MDAQIDWTPTCARGPVGVPAEKIFLTWCLPSTWMPRDHFKDGFPKHLNYDLSVFKLVTSPASLSFLSDITMYLVAQAKTWQSSLMVLMSTAVNSTFPMDLESADCYPSPMLSSLSRPTPWTWNLTASQVFLPSAHVPSERSWGASERI